METINIIFASNDNYAQPMGVAIYSLLDNFLSDKYIIKIIILDGGILEGNKDKIKEIGKKFSVEIEFVKISDEIFKEVKYIGRYTLATYYRLIIPNILGQEVKKALYLDCDILVMGNIVELYKKDINNYLLGAVQARCYENRKYFSAGVLLINLEKMRAENFVEKAFDFIKINTEELDQGDQTVLNYICKDKWLRLENIWNFEIERSEQKVFPSPIVLHYITNYKPWHRFYHNYYQKYYRKYIKKWPGYKIQNPGLKVAAKQILKYIPFSVPLARLVKGYKMKICF